MTRASIALDKTLLDYIVQHCPPEHPELKILREKTRDMPRGRMQVAPEQGHFLAFLVKLAQARRILEVGTFTGYSSLSMALALAAEGRLVTCDMSEDWTNLARGAWAAAGVASKIELKLGPGLETLASMEREGMASFFDMAFVDANKEDYDGYYESCLRLVRQGGLIVLDNMFRDGRVTDPSATDPSVTCIHALNEKIAGDERVDRVLIPVGDGMTLVRRR
jgi:O-methyltransferase